MQQGLARKKPVMRYYRNTKTIWTLSRRRKRGVMPFRKKPKINGCEFKKNRTDQKKELDAIKALYRKTRDEYLSGVPRDELREYTKDTERLLAGRGLS
jgi:hypothetical protein